MSLSDWEKNDWLKAHKTSTQEIEGLLSIVERELKDAQVKGISSDGKFTHAYRLAAVGNRSGQADQETTRTASRC
jgi:hypothetical protein